MGVQLLNYYTMTHKSRIRYDPVWDADSQLPHRPNSPSPIPESREHSISPTTKPRSYAALVLPLFASTTTNPHVTLRTLADFALSHGYLLKNLQKRLINIQDLLVVPADIENPRPVATLVVSTPEHYSGSLRHADVTQCPHLAIAMYLFSRFHIPDEYGSIELTPEFVSDPLFNDTKLLKGSNRFSAMSYSQQHKAAGRVARLAGLDGPEVATILLDLANDKPLLSRVENLPVHTMIHKAGFDAKYVLKRDSSDPPPEVEAPIFPFIDNLNPQLQPVFKHLRKTICQDVVWLRLLYPDNPVCQHPLFNTPEFLRWAHTVGPHDLPIMPITHRLSSRSASASTETLVLSDFTYDHPRGSEDWAAAQYENQLAAHRQEIEALKRQLAEYIAAQTDVHQSQKASLRRVADAANGMAILMALSNPSTAILTAQLLARSAALLTSSSSVIERSISATTDLLDKVAAHQHSMAHELMAPPQRVSPPPPLPQQIERRRVLHRRLSRQAITVHEMWDDFKSLEADLKKHNISNTEWLKVHGLSERQFKHTRNKIVRFVEEEASRTNLSVEEVKEKLHQKMRNRQRPWTLDEVQRMLTSGKRIDLLLDK